MCAGAARLDEWLSQQPQAAKLVIRGNHDPYDVDFPLSGAIYVTTPRSVTLGGVTFACVPYGKGASPAAWASKCAHPAVPHS